MINILNAEREKTIVRWQNTAIRGGYLEHWTTPLWPSIYGLWHKIGDHRSVTRAMMEVDHTHSLQSTHNWQFNCKFHKLLFQRFFSGEPQPTTFDLRFDWCWMLCSTENSLFEWVAWQRSMRMKCIMYDVRIHNEIIIKPHQRLTHMRIMPALPVNNKRCDACMCFVCGLWPQLMRRVVTRPRFVFIHLRHRCVDVCVVPISVRCMCETVVLYGFRAASPNWECRRWMKLFLFAVQ